jgi:hypothetical protein
MSSAKGIACAEVGARERMNALEALDIHCAQFFRAEQP